MSCKCIFYPCEQGLRSELEEACNLLKWTEPTPIQREAIPLALQGTFLFVLDGLGNLVIIVNR